MSPCGSEPYAYDDNDVGPASGNRRAKVLRRLRRGRPRQTSPAALWSPEPDDRRFSDPAWSSDPKYQRLLQYYLTWSRLTLAAAEAPYLPVRRRQQLQFLAQVVTEALAPVNFLPGNPAALRRAADTRGVSLVRGSGNLLHDVVRRRGRPAKMPPGAYRLGEDLAATPGRVVYRNELMELIQYEPQTAEVHQVPLLFVPAWVNKFYIYDLAPDRSLVEWAVREGFTVFAISLRDPEPDQAGLGLDEYLPQAPLRALDVVREITGAPRAHLVGVCAGGMFAASAAAWLAAGGEARVASLTLLMSALDYAGPDGREKSSEAEIDLLTRMLSNKRGLVDGKKISLLFDLLRPRETIWQPLVSGWLMGDRPQPFDIWAWSEDGIDVPDTLFKQTLRIAADNSLAQRRLRIDDRTIDLSAVTQDAFVVAGSRDHIIPWETVYRSARLLGGDVAFHLVPSGHVGGIISPPRPKADYLIGGDGLPPRPQDWLARAASQHESWWTAWSRWLGPRSGPRVPSRTTGSARYPARTPAPGRYVLPGDRGTAGGPTRAASPRRRVRRRRARLAPSFPPAATGEAAHGWTNPRWKNAPDPERPSATA
ncbi:alpha/beta fold hydrolase [Streptomyces sp. TRM76323]|uniref:Alpha/beta fold hydrolase n=1 Tax=Streptomyces tamarix TaxID=3078565 RepID=A0ABU3QPC4_9ACTN|nr:alpha/beta fold hydrolase [Streptomyces tamarix]MDT9684610.1 alpha/beta fold hydrolase [Streptomyces tamarix]